MPLNSPQDLWDIVARWARRLGRPVAGDDLFLLALTELPHEEPARRALEAERLDSSRILDASRAIVGADGEEFDGCVTFNPAVYTMNGRAEGFAATLGDGTVRPEHVLMALLWEPRSISSHVVSRFGAERESVITRLRDMGVPVPQTPLPVRRKIGVVERVWIERDQVQPVTRYLSQHIPPETFWGFNYEEGRAWVIAETHVDLQRLVQEALDGVEQPG